MHKFLFTIVFFCCALSLHAQDKPFEYSDSSLLIESQQTVNTGTVSDEDSIVTENRDILSDTTLYINPIEIVPDSITKWKSDRRFGYMKNLERLLKEKQQQEVEADDKPADNSGSFLYKLLTSPFIRLFFWGVAVCFVLFLIYKLFLSNGIFRRNTRSSPLQELPTEEEPVTVSDYDKLIHQSCKLGDYRMAVRYLFLKNLARLADKEYLHLSADKTNYQYVQEIRADKKNEFASLVLTYEYIWYGNFPLNQEAYTGIEKRYSSFFHKI